MNKKKLWLGIGAALFAVLVIIFIVIQPKKEPEVIKIGAILPLTGDASIYGSALKEGLDLALEEINTKGGIIGKKVVVIYEDSQADPKVAVSAINKLINIDKVKIILGEMFSSVTLAIAPIAQKSQVVLISPTVSAEAVPNVGDYIFSIYPSDAYDGKFLANFVYNEIEKKNAAIIFVQADAMLSCKNSFKSTFENLGGKVVFEEGYAPKTDDYRTILSKIKQLNNLDIVFIPGYLEEIVKLLRQAEEFGIKHQFITISTAYDNKLFELGGNSVDGLLMSAPFFEISSTRPEIINFKESLKKRYSREPNVWAAYGYDVLKIALLGYENSLKYRTEMKDELLKIKNYPGVTGITSFLPNGSVEKMLKIMVARQGKFIEYNQ